MEIGRHARSQASVRDHPVGIYLTEGLENVGAVRSCKPRAARHEAVLAAGRRRAKSTAGLTVDVAMRTGRSPALVDQDAILVARRTLALMQVKPAALPLVLEW
jgi:hypothetical protein